MIDPGRCDRLAPNYYAGRDPDEVFLRDFSPCVVEALVGRSDIRTFQATRAGRRPVLAILKSVATEVEARLGDLRGTSTKASISFCIGRIMRPRRFGRGSSGSLARSMARRRFVWPCVMNLIPVSGSRLTCLRFVAAGQSGDGIGWETEPAGNRHDGLACYD